MYHIQSRKGNPLLFIQKVYLNLNCIGVNDSVNYSQENINTKIENFHADYF